VLREWPRLHANKVQHNLEKQTKSDPSINTEPQLSQNNLSDLDTLENTNVDLNAPTITKATTSETNTEFVRSMHRRNPAAQTAADKMHVVSSSSCTKY